MNISPIELQAHQRLAETGLSVVELLSMDMSEYARVTGRPTVGQLAAQAHDVEPPGSPRQEMAPQVPQESVGIPRGIDVAALDMDEYAAVRGQLGMGVSHQEGRGIFDSISSRSDEYISAVRAQAGRTAMSTSNVVESPRINRVFLNPDAHRDPRTVAQRLSTPANMWQG